MPGLRVAVAVLALASSGLVAARGSAPAPPDRYAAVVLQAARKQLGAPYKWGGNGPGGWDCSGLTANVWRSVGVRWFPRTSREQQRAVWPITAAQARPGDLVFFDDPVTHVAIYLGGNRILDASSSRKKVVERTIWKAKVVRYGRVPRPGLRPPGRAPAVAPRPVARPAARPAGNGAVPGPGHRPAADAWQRKVASASVARVGSGWSAKGAGPSYDAAGLVRAVVRAVDGRKLPDNPAALERMTRPVALRDLRVGDLVFYGAPAVHVGVYVGNGQMVDSSRVLRKVVKRRVFTSETVRFARLRR